MFKTKNNNFIIGKYLSSVYNNIEERYATLMESVQTHIKRYEDQACNDQPEYHFFQFIQSLGGYPVVSPGMNWTWIHKIPSTIDKRMIEQYLDDHHIEHRGVNLTISGKYYEFRYRF